MEDGRSHAALYTARKWTLFSDLGPPASAYFLLLVHSDASLRYPVPGVSYNQLATNRDPTQIFYSFGALFPSSRSDFEPPDLSPKKSGGVLCSMYVYCYDIMNFISFVILSPRCPRPPRDGTRIDAFFLCLLNARPITVTEQHNSGQLIHKARRVHRMFVVLPVSDLDVLNASGLKVQ